MLKNGKCKLPLSRVGALAAATGADPALLLRMVLASSATGSEPGTWPLERADSVCSKVQSGGTPKAGFAADGVPFVKVYNIVHQALDFDYRPQYISAEQQARELSKSKTLPGDVLMNIVGPPLGKVAVVIDAHPEWNINQAITLFRPSSRVMTDWLYIVLREGSAWASVLKETKGSVGQVNISLSQCRAFMFPVPPVGEQARICKRVETLFAVADRLEARLANALSAAEKLTPATLSKAFRGELVPQDPEDEPAAALLARIRAEREAVPTAAPGRRRVTA